MMNSVDAPPLQEPKENIATISQIVRENLLYPNDSRRCKHSQRQCVKNLCGVLNMKKKKGYTKIVSLGLGCSYHKNSSKTLH